MLEGKPEKVIKLLNPESLISLLTLNLKITPLQEISNDIKSREIYLHNIPNNFKKRKQITSLIFKHVAEMATILNFQPKYDLLSRPKATITLSRKSREKLLKNRIIIDHGNVISLSESPEGPKATFLLTCQKLDSEEKAFDKLMYLGISPSYVHLPKMKNLKPYHWVIFSCNGLQKLPTDVLKLTEKTCLNPFCGQNEGHSRLCTKMQKTNK